MIALSHRINHFCPEAGKRFFLPHSQKKFVVSLNKHSFLNTSRLRNGTVNFRHNGGNHHCFGNIQVHHMRTWGLLQFGHFKTCFLSNVLERKLTQPKGVFRLKNLTLPASHRIGHKHQHYRGRATLNECYSNSLPSISLLLVSKLYKGVKNLGIKKQTINVLKLFNRNGADIFLFPWLACQFVPTLSCDKAFFFYSRKGKQHHHSRTTKALTFL